MIVNNILERVFLLEDKGKSLALADPSKDFSPEQVMNFYAPTYPILTTAKVEGPEISGDKLRYKFLTTLGTKG